MVGHHVASTFFILKVTPFIHNHRANVNVSRKGNRMKCPMASSIFLKHCSTPVKSGQNPNRLFAPFLIKSHSIENIWSR